MTNRGTESSGQAPHNRVYMTEARRDLEESKRSVRDLLRMRQQLYGGKKSDHKMSDQELKQLREKAIRAIDHLFEDETDGAN